MSTFTGDLSVVPALTYLEHYPFPAFVLQRKDTSPTNHTFSNGDSSPPSTESQDAHHPLQETIEIVWGNSPWNRLLGEDSLQQSVDSSSYTSFLTWLTKPSVPNTLNDQDGEPNKEVFSLYTRQGRQARLIKTILPTSPFIIVTAINLSPLAPVNNDHDTPLQDPSSPPADEKLNVPNDSNPSILQDSSVAVHRSIPTTADINLPVLSIDREQVPDTTDCKLLLKQTDWSKTCLGPREKWSASIEVMINLVMTSKTQDGLWLGSEFVMIYNQHYALTVDHPRMFGRSAKHPEAFGPVWDGVSQLIQQAIQDGEACYTPDDLLLYHRGPRGHFVERYHSWSFIPIFDLDGSVLGTYNPTTDSTAAVLAYRRQQTTKSISDRTSNARNTQEYCEGIAEAVETNPKDVPFLLCYSIEEVAQGKNKEGGTDVCLSLQSSVGVPKEHASTPDKLDLRISSNRSAHFLNGTKSDQLSSPTLSAISRMSTDTFGKPLVNFNQDAWPIAQALSTRQLVVVDDCSRLVTGFPLRQWDHLPESAIIIPICSQMTNETPRGVLIMGLNLRCPLDDEYQDWIQVTRAQLTSALTSVIALEAEQRRLADVERLERAKTAWFQGAAHDLRSPLTLVAGPLGDVLESKDLRSDHRQALVMAQRNVLRIQRLVTALLDFSRIEAGKLVPRFLPMDIGPFINDLAALFRPAAARRGIEYRVEIGSQERQTYVDPTLLETVVVNLLSNALKYTEKGVITVRLCYTSTHAEVSVIDTGPGIPQAELAMVTDRFHRTTAALARGIEGTGIGLALAKEIVRLHGGDLTIESQTAEESDDGTHGSTFSAHILLAERDVAENEFHAGHTFGSYGKDVVAETMHWTTGSQTDETSDTGRSSDLDSNNVPALVRSEGLLFNKTDVLLLVDDNADIRRYIKKLFNPFCTVIEASDGEEALSIASRSPPDIILSDLMMPRMNGQELLYAIRQEPCTRSVPVVLLSAATNDELRLSALTNGVDDFILKPFKPRELLARVHLHMQLGKKRIKLEQLFAQREQEISLLSDYCPSGIIRQCADGTMIYGNAAWRSYTGLKEGEDLNGWLAQVDPVNASVLASKLHDFLQGDARELQYSWRWLNGRVVAGTFIRLDKVIAGMSGVLGCLSDITHQEEQILEAERRRIEAEESKRQQELLVDFTSHEIRTPVSAILQCSSLVKENLISLKRHLEDTRKSQPDQGFIPNDELLASLAEDVEALEGIYQCGLTQERIANDILSLARIQLDTLSLHDVDVDLRLQGQKLVRVFASEAKMKRIELSAEFGQSIESGALSVVKTDHVRLGQVVTNLTSNAMKFTANSDIRRITVRFDLSFLPPSANDCAIHSPVPDMRPPATLESDAPIWLFVSVKDTGPGLSATELAALFQKFSQGNKMIHSQYGGSGLGLYICKKITEALGGRIEVQSELGIGSEFRFFIRCRTVAPDSIPPYLRRLSREQTPTGKRIQASSSKNIPSTRTIKPQTPSAAQCPDGNLHVLIVEDNIINQTVLRRQMIKTGFTCDVANNGQEALDLLHSNREAREQGLPGKSYDVVLMDLEMPIMDGLTAIGIIREQEASGILSVRQLVIALTGNARQAQIEEALAAGMDDVVIKPYRLPDLLDKVRKAIVS